MEPLTLSYVRTAEGTPAQALLGDNDSVWRLHPSRVYALVGRNGAGKSSLLQHAHAKTLTGFPPHVTTFLVSQHHHQHLDHHDSSSETVYTYLSRVYATYRDDAARAHAFAVQRIEAAMEALDLENSPQGQDEMEALLQEQAELEDCEDEDDTTDTRALLQDTDWQQGLAFMGLHVQSDDNNNDDNHHNNNNHHNIVRGDTPMAQLTPGQRQKVRLAAVWLCPSQLVLLDEPTLHLDVEGLWRLRRLILHLRRGHGQNDPTTSTTPERPSSSPTTVVLATHDVDLLNDVVTDVIHWRNRNLYYYTGPYHDFLRQRQQETTQQQRHVATVTRKKQAAQETLQHVKEQNPSRRRGGAAKKAKRVAAQRQKLNRIAADEQQARAQLLNINDNDTHNHKHHHHNNHDGSEDKAIQFVFRNPKSQWHEPLILAYGVGHGYGDRVTASTDDRESAPFSTTTTTTTTTSPIVDVDENGYLVIRKREGFLFDCVDLCIEEGGTYAILGPNASGKTTLLRLLAGLEKPVEGQIKFASNVNVAYVSSEEEERPWKNHLDTTVLAFLMHRFPQKTEQDIRGEMTNFGCGPHLASTRLAFLSGGERARLHLVTVFLSSVPDVLVWDDPSAHLDPTSVQALLRGLNEWQGTLIMVSHDSFFLRELQHVSCLALVPEEGKLRRVEGGIDEYVRSFAKEMTNL